MKASPEIQNLFYQHLGKLFYAIAAADKVIREEEVTELKRIVNSDWLDLGEVKDKSEIDAMRQIKITFTQLRDLAQKPYDSLAEFKSFKKAHESLFTDEVKQLIWKTANEITNSFARLNKSELVMLSELGIILRS